MNSSLSRPSRLPVLFAAGAVCLLAAAGAGWYVHVRTVPMPDITFDGDRIECHLPADRFLSLPYSERVEKLAGQVDEVIRYVRTRTGRHNLVDIASCIHATSNRTLVIQATPDVAQMESFRWNRGFVSNVVYSDNQSKLAAEVVEELIEDTTVTSNPNDLRVRMTGISDTGFYVRDHLVGGAKYYLERAMITHDIAANILSGATSDQERVERLMEFTFVTVSNHFVRKMGGHREYTDFNDVPLELMVRGMGACDRSAWVLTRLMYHAGLPSHVVYLHRAEQEGKTSFHTIAEVRVGNRWQAIDPFNNVIYDKSILDLSRDTEYFKHSFIFLNHTSPHAYTPILKLAELVYQQYRPEQRFTSDIRRAVDQYLADLFQNPFGDPGEHIVVVCDKDDSRSGVSGALGNALLDEGALSPDGVSKIQTVEIPLHQTVSGGEGHAASGQVSGGGGNAGKSEIGQDGSSDARGGKGLFSIGRTLLSGPR